MANFNQRFLLPAGTTYTAGSTGGSTSHTHPLSANGGAAIRKYSTVLTTGRISNANMPAQADGHYWKTTFAGDADAGTSYGRSGIGLFGNTDSTTTLPPYLAVYMWERTA